MIGPFYPESVHPGLHSEEFRPFASPVPLLVIRGMQLLDLPFLCREPATLREYCRNFRISSPDDLEARLRRSGIRTRPLGWDECLRSITRGKTDAQ